MIAAPLLLASLAAILQTEPHPQETTLEDPRVLLHEAVSLPKEKDRAAAAKALGKRRDVDLQQWLGLMREFGEFEAATPGYEGMDVKLLVGTKMMDTRLEVFVPSSYAPATPSPL